MVVRQTYRFALDPNNRQRRRLASHAGSASGSESSLHAVACKDGLAVRGRRTGPYWDDFRTAPVELSVSQGERASSEALS